jgi:ribose transport system ATP-binding protein
MSYIDNLCFPLERRSPFLWANSRARNCVRREYEKFLGPDIHEEDISRLSPLSLCDLIYYRVCIFNPKVVFCIEPLSEADQALRKRVMSLIQTLLDRGISVVTISSVMRENLLLSDRAIVVEKGSKTREYSRSDFPGLKI